MGSSNLVLKIISVEVGLCSCIFALPETDNFLSFDAVLKNLRLKEKFSDNHGKIFVVFFMF